MQCHPIRVLRFRLGPVVLAGAAALTSGCGFVRFQIQLDPGAVVEAALPVSTGGALPGSRPGAPQASTAGGFAPEIASPQGSGGNAPVTSLPPPVEVKAHAKELTARFGLRGISGIGVTEEKLKQLETACAYYPRDCIQGLEFVFELDDNMTSAEHFQPMGIPTPDPEMLIEGVWDPPTKVTENGDIDTTGWRPRITFFPAVLRTSTMTHEIAHHVTLFADTSFGVRLLESMGYVTDPDPALMQSDGLDWRVLFGTWTPRAVARSAYPTGYARSFHSEHLAELIAYHLDPETFSGEDTILAGFTFPPGAKMLVKRRLGGS